MSGSKVLAQDDSSGFAFAQEMLGGDPTYAINFDRIQKHPEKGYIIFEYLLCEENQTVNPHTSHPNNYFRKNSRKFIALNEIAQDLGATLYLVNYAKKDTKHEDKIRLMKVQAVDPQNTENPVDTKNWDLTREEFSKRFRELNKECKGS